MIRRLKKVNCFDLDDVFKTFEKFFENLLEKKRCLRIDEDTIRERCALLNLNNKFESRELQVL